VIRRRALLAALTLLGIATPAAAQTWVQPDKPRRGSWEIGGGAAWSPETDFGERRAQQTRNPTTGTDPFEVFTADTTLQAAPGATAYLAFYLSRAISVEAGLRYARPQLRVRLSGDAEDAETLTALEDVSQYQFEGSVVWHLTNLSFASGRAVPFVIGGAGHIRDLHQGNDLVETGSEFHGGGGLKWWFGSGAERWGLRFEARATSREGGFALGRDRRTVSSAGVSLAYIF
jgi:hypothetical protein